MINHQRRFLISCQSSAGAIAAVPPALAPAPNSQSSLATLAHLYAMAYEQARESVQRRQWEELLERLFNSQV